MKSLISLNHVFAFIALGASSLLGTGCGKSIVTAVGVSSAVQDGDQYAEVFADFNTSGMTLPSVTLPIANPLGGGPTYGQVILNSTSASTAQVNINLDLTVLAKLPAGDSLLPNGSAVPVSGTTAVKMLTIPVPNTKFVVYLALNIDALNTGKAPVAMIGIAMPFTQLDQIGTSLGNVDLFIPFNVSGVAGTAGVFAGKTSGTSGLGIFIDASQLIVNLSPSPSTGTTMMAFQQAQMTRSAPSTSAKLGFLSISPGASRERKITNHLSNLGAHRTQLTIE